MEFYYIQKLTLIDYPGKVASTLFTYGCNFRCPFCHNPELVIDDWSKNATNSYDEEYLLDFFRNRVGKIDAVVVTGGEPLLWDDKLLSFLKKVKAIGLLIKVDTNGSFPNIVEKYNAEKIVDYWAMDIKYPPKCYGEYNIDINTIQKSIDLIMNSGSDYEFRTTYVKGIHDIEDAHDIGKLIKGSNNYYIQNFRTGKTIDPEMSEKNSFTEKELEKIKNIVSKYVKNVKIR